MSAWPVSLILVLVAAAALAFPMGQRMSLQPAGRTGPAKAMPAAQRASRACKLKLSSSCWGLNGYSYRAGL